MRELGFSKLDWQNYITGKPKLAQPRFTSFRFTRKDKDWYISETVKVVYRPRSHTDRSVLGLALIEASVPRWVYAHQYLTQIKPNLDYSLAKQISEQEAKADGFSSRGAMVDWARGVYKHRIWKEPMNMLTISWTQRWLNVPEQKPHIAEEWVDLLGLGSMKL